MMKGEGIGGGLEEGMPTELSHAAIRDLLTQHHWSMTETNVVKRSGHKRTESHRTSVSRDPRGSLDLLSARQKTSLNKVGINHCWASPEITIPQLNQHLTA